MYVCSTFLNEETRRAMGEQAVALSRAVEYSSAGRFVQLRQATNVVMYSTFTCILMCCIVYVIPAPAI